MPISKTDKNATPYFVLTFRCLDETKILEYLRNYNSLQQIIPDHLYQKCVIHKKLLTSDQKKEYMKLSRNYTYYSSDMKNDSKKRNRDNEIKEEDNAKKTVKKTKIMNAMDNKMNVNVDNVTEIQNYKKNNVEESNINEKKSTKKISLPFKGGTISSAKKNSHNNSNSNSNSNGNVKDNDVNQIHLEKKENVDEDMILFHFLNK